jgi:hypothetical protein
LPLPLLLLLLLQAERVAHLGCSPQPLSINQLLPEHAASQCSKRQRTDVQQQQQQRRQLESQLLSEQQQQQQQPVKQQQPDPTADPRTDRWHEEYGSSQQVWQIAAAAAAAYLSRHIEAARQADVLAACSSVKEVSGWSPVPPKSTTCAAHKLQCNQASTTSRLM